MKLIDALKITHPLHDFGRLTDPASAAFPASDPNAADDSGTHFHSACTAHEIEHCKFCEVPCNCSPGEHCDAPDCDQPAEEEDLGDPDATLEAFLGRHYWMRGDEGEEG